MTNERLVAQVKQSDRAAPAALREQNSVLLAILFRRLYVRAGVRTAQAVIAWKYHERVLNKT